MPHASPMTWFFLFFYSIVLFILIMFSVDLLPSFRLITSNKKSNRSGCFMW